MTLSVIGSGSKGNCYVLQNEEEALIIEAGTPFDEKAKQALGWNTAKIKAVIISHAHNDHAGYSKQYTDAGIRVMALQDTIVRQGLDNMFATPYEPGKGFKVGGFKVLPFPLVHYNTDGTRCPNCGFLITHDETGRIVFFTDCQAFSRQVQTEDGLQYIPYDFPNVSHWMIEANYDDYILHRSKIEDFVKNRIRKSHMSLNNTIKVAKRVDLSRTREILLIHLSDGNSDDRKFVQEMRKATGKRVYAAHAGLMLDYNETPEI